MKDKIIVTEKVKVSYLGYAKTNIHVGLSAGVFMLAFQTEASTLELRKSDNLTPLLPATNPSETAINTHYYEDISYGTLPDTPGILTLASGDVPRIWVQVA